MTRIDRMYKQLANDICEYTKGQSRFWQKVPHWALEADGREGWKELYEQAYTQGLWWPDLLLPRGIWNLPAIDCESGDLVRGKEPNSLTRITNPDSIVPLMKFRDMLDAGKVLEDLREKAILEGRHGSKQDGIERERRRHLYNVQPVFTRASGS